MVNMLLVVQAVDVSLNVPIEAGSSSETSSTPDKSHKTGNTTEQEKKNFPPPRRYALPLKSLFTPSNLMVFPLFSRLFTL